MIYVPHGRDDILNTANGRPDHGGRVGAAGAGVTINQYYGRASRASNNSSTSINQQKLDEVIVRLREEMRRSLCSPPIKADIQQLGAHVSPKGSNAETGVHSLGEDVANVIPSIGLYVQLHDGTQLVHWEKYCMGVPPYTVWLMQMMW
ncbi:hypothetical protein HKD37_13G037203 [Glycine soja]